MAFAILRVAKLKTAGNVGGLNGHLTRTMEVPNADPDLASYNRRPIGTENLNEDIKKRLESAGIKDIRKNGVLAIEHLITASPEAFQFYTFIKENGEKEIRGNGNEWNDFENKAKEWLKETYGAQNLVNFTVHMDEKSPHIHAIVVPIDSKGKLNCREFLGGREKLSEMQTNFAKKVEHLGIERGIEGSKAKHQDVKKFYEVIRDAKPVNYLLTPLIKVETPEKGMFGYKDSRELVAENETKRINEVISTFSKNANLKLKEASYNIKLGNVLQNENNGLRATLNQFDGKNKQLEQDKKKLAEEKNALIAKHNETLKNIAEGKITPERLKQHFEEIERKKQKKDQSRGM